MRAKQIYEHYERSDEGTDGFIFCPFCCAKLVLAESGPHPRRACPSCGFTQFRNPAPTVSILIVKGDRVLLGKRGGHPGKGKWSLPAGYIEYEDDFVTAAIREAREETGLEVQVSAIINVVSSFVSPRFHFLGLYLVAEAVGGELRAGDDLEAVDWFAIAGPLPEMGFQEDVDVIKLYADGVEGLPVETHGPCAGKRSGA